MDVTKKIRELNNATYLSRGGQPQHSQQALTLAIKFNMNTLIAESQVYLGICHNAQGKVKQALSCLKEANQHFLQHEPTDWIAKKAEGDMYCGIGIAYDDLEKYLKSVWYHKHSLMIAQEIDDPYGQQRAFLNLGFIYGTRLGLISEALTYLSNSINHPNQHSRLLSTAYEHLADNFEAHGEWKEALEHRLRAIEMADKDEKIKIARNYLKLAQNNGRCGNIKVASQQIEIVWNILKNVESNTLIYAKAYLSHGYIMIYHNQFDEAVRQASQAQLIAKVVEIKWIDVAIQILFFEIYFAQGKWEKCESIIDELFPLDRLAYFQRRKINNLMLTEYQRRGDWKQAFSLSEQLRVGNDDIQHNLHMLYKLKQEIFKKESAKKTNALLTKKNQQLQLLHHEKDELFKIIAHDLRNPLAILMLNTQRLQLFQKKHSLKKRDEVLTSTITTIEKMNSLISQLHLAAQAESKHHSVKQYPYPLYSLLANIVKQQQELALEKQQQITIKASGDNLQVDVNQTYLEQVLTNLLSNAIKYSPAKKPILIHMKPKRESQVQIQIIDEGLGLTIDDKSKIFGKYSRLSAKPTGNESSTGLGLYIVKKLVEKMGGTVSAKSPGENRGSTFSLIIPRC